jgi:guanine deaminase
LESSLSDLSRAAHVYNRVVSRTLSHGTTTAAYYATIHVPATNLLADICQRRGQRAFVGRVCADAMGPDYYRDESPEQTLAATRECMAHVQKIDPAHELITPIITPRFAPACSLDCLRQLGMLHRETGYPCQTHISENKPECELVARLFPDSASYTGVYDDAGLLTDKMILAHAVHLSDEEIALVSARKAKISHCPSSNTALTSGTAKVRKLLNAGIDVGLGTDVSGGFSTSVLEVARHSIWVSRHVAMTDGDAAKLSVEDVLYLATRGGAKVVGLADQIGGFEVGMDWDAQLISLNSVDPDAEIHHPEKEVPVDVFGWETWEDRIHKWVYGGDDRNTAAVWVKGRLVHRTGRHEL